MSSLRLPSRYEGHWRDALAGLIQALPRDNSPVEVDSQDWVLRCQDLQDLQHTLEGAGYGMLRLRSAIDETIVSARALGHVVVTTSSDDASALETPTDTAKSSLLFHQGTLRSGDHLQSKGDVLLYGDVNPGARISAVGHIQIWGRLRGIAHAGCEGDRSATVVAHQLRPLQLRVADVVARGPDEQPQVGLMEQARLDNGEIVIEPAAGLPIPSHR